MKCPHISQVDDIKYTKEIALVANPNVGKSCLFNQFTGIGACVSNYPGTTVDVMSGLTNLTYFKNIKITDLPGTYSFGESSEDEKVTKDYINCKNPSAIINVVDSNNLERNLYLTLQLIEHKLPIIIALNFIEEARDKGINIDSNHLSSVLGVPVIEVDCLNGKGMEKLAKKCEEVMGEKVTFNHLKIKYDDHIENLLKEIESLTGNKRELVLDFLEGSKLDWHNIRRKGLIHNLIRKYKRFHDISTYISKDRHGQAALISEKVTKLGETKEIAWHEKLSRWTIEPKSGIIILILVLSSIFYILFTLGASLESILVNGFRDYIAPILTFLINFIPLEFVRKLLESGLITGIEAGLAIAIPYIAVFYVLMAILEDSGYLTRMAYLLDRVMHKLKLHGKSMIPLMLGFGCNVPAILSTRTLSSFRERFITIVMVCLVPCSAVTAVILGATAKYLGWRYAMLIYFIDLIVIVSAGYILGRLLPGESTGLILEMPPFRLPSIKGVFKKTWIRLKDFVYIAFPFLIAGAALVGILNDYGLIQYLMKPFEPLMTGLLGLPASAGITLIFGIFRKEMALEMLIALGGTSNLLAFLTPLQIFVFTLITSLYIPCVATIAVLGREVGWKRATYVIVATIIIAIIFGALASKLFPLLGILT
ncbi:MAG: ferrous iron transport protein B [Nanoarchaeota archaeon]|nr:ferrous iron transport protein B [Nanoarchaeota archaeon]MBU1005740.1 ferrous iron transport protein B [Nanoarchaeota archaeon]MBU1945575.1 ferrous iron transport protein B [Nanoarchaeota archaeon]